MTPIDKYSDASKKQDLVVGSICEQFLNDQAGQPFSQEKNMKNITLAEYKKYLH